jgi:hypothetical protein
MELDAGAELNRVKDIMNDAAKCLSAFNSDYGKKQFCEMFLTQADVLWCSHDSCRRAYKNAQQHSGWNRAEHQASNHFSQRTMKYPKMPSSTRIFFAEDEWHLQQYKSKFSKLFKQARNTTSNQIPVDFHLAAALQVQVRNRNPLLQLTGNQFQDDANILSIDILQEVRPKGPGRLPKRTEIISKIAEGQQSEVESGYCLNGEQDYSNAAAFFEREHIAPSLGDHSKLLQFENDIGIRMHVCKSFDGSYARFTQYASMYMSRPATLWEKCLERAFYQFYYLANEQVDSISPTVRSQLMVIGDGSASRLLSKIIQGTNEAAEIVDELVGEANDIDIEDGETRAGELKQQYEKFAKDMIELVGGQNGLANAGRAYLQRIQGETFKKYQRVGLLFVLFMARTLEAEEDVDNDQNVRWWHQLGRPTLVSCMSELQTQHEQQQQPQQGANNENGPSEPVVQPILNRATTVVMKLLLIALELENDRTKDYGHELGIHLPLSSQFLLCRTIHIHKDDDDDDSSSDGDLDLDMIMSDEDGSFIIRPTSPGRAQATAAALMNVFRVTFAAAMVHAAETNDLQLQQVLWSPSVFSFSQPIRDLAYRSKIARCHAQHILTGTARAEPIVDKDKGVTGWKVSTRADSQPFLYKSDIVSGIRKMCDKGQELISKVLQELMGMAANIAIGDILKQHIFTQEVDLVSAMNNLPVAFFGQPVAFVDEQLCIEFQMQVARPTVQNPSKKLAAPVQGKIMGATFRLSEDCTVDSQDLVAAITAIIIHENDTAAVQQFTKIFDEVGRELLYIVLTLLQWSVRGKARQADINMAKCGSSNAYIDFSKPDFFCHSMGELKDKNLIFARFPSCKFAGNRQREYPWLLLPEEVSRLVGIYFSVFRCTQVKYLDHLINRNQHNNIDFGKRAKSAMMTKEDAKFLLLNQVTKLTSNIKIHDKVIAKPLYNWDAVVQ